MNDYRYGGETFGLLLMVCSGFFLFGAAIGFAIGTSWTSHEQGVRDALAGKYVVVQLPDGTSVVVENKEQRP